jgi:hypothetical protein
MNRDLAEVIATIDTTSWQQPLEASAVDALEDGKVLFFPNLGFALRESEKRFLSPDHMDPKSKNMSFNASTGEAKHAVGTDSDVAAFATMMRRYYEHARSLVAAILPSYAEALTGRTSFRPVEIRGRKTSPRKDDTRLHIDAFPSLPVGGNRILRVFSNVNPNQQDRIWRIGEDFESVARRFVSSIPTHFWVSGWIMEKIGATKGFRTLYDNAMLSIHDAMKMDGQYQQDVVQNEFRFPAGSTWIVYTDHVSHAAIAGQHAFEQTFYLPVSAMADQSKASLRILERLTGNALV